MQKGMLRHRSFIAGTLIVLARPLGGEGQPATSLNDQWRRAARYVEVVE